MFYSWGMLGTLHITAVFYVVQHIRFRCIPKRPSCKDAGGVTPNLSETGQSGGRTMHGSLVIVVRQSQPGARICEPYILSWHHHGYC